MASSSSSSSSSFLYNIKPWLYLTFLFILHTLLYLPTCSSQPQNIETTFPIQPPPPAAAIPPAPAVGPAGVPPSSSSKIKKAVAITAASTAVISVIVFLFIRWCAKKRRVDGTRVSSASDARADVSPGHNNDNNNNGFERIEGNVKGLIVDENGLDVIYWRKLQQDKNNTNDNSDHILENGLLRREVLTTRSIGKEQDQEQEVIEHDDDGDGNSNSNEKKSDVVQEIPLLRGMSSASERNSTSKDERGSSRNWIRALSRKVAPPPPETAAPAVVSPPLPLPPAAAYKAKNSGPPPPPRPLISDKLGSPAVPPPPPLPAKGPAPPPPPPPGGLRSSLKPPPTPVEMAGEESEKVKLKPLHWDKVTTNVDHSMVWDKLDGGSFRVDQNMMEALFGYVATNKRTAGGKENSSSPSREATSAQTSSTTFILDSRKSQNIAIVLKSLGVSRREVIDAIDEGQGLNSEMIEKLVRVAPTQEEQSEILEFNGDPSKLAIAESFLYDVLKAVPSAFKRLNAMLFRYNYDSEVLEIKESLNTLELGCKELKQRGLFVKLLEAVLKAGNRMNAGTSRGNAQAFSLSSLRKLSDVKSTDGKTTLLHFVVEEVVRSEGKRCVINRDHGMNRSGSRRMSNGKGEDQSEKSDEQREMEYLKLGLPFVGGISTEFSNVKKSAIIDYNSLVSSISLLSTRISEIKQLVSQCGNGEGGNFVREMEHFLSNAEADLRSVRDEEKRVMQIVKKTTEYYQGGTYKAAENLLEIFVIVKDFLGMVDQACIDIARNMQQQKRSTKSTSR